jgi:hypothetical protein
MHYVLSPRRAGVILGFGALAFGSAAVGVATASTRSASAAATPQQTVIASLITRRPGTLKPDSLVSSSALGQRVFIDAKHGFALANAGQAQYAAATTDGGKTWRTDGPALHIDAAQAPLSVTSIGLATVKTVYAYGSGQVVDITGDGGKHWYGALFNGLVMAVVRRSGGHLVAFVDASPKASATGGVTWQYVSKNGGRTWKYDPRVGGS